MNTNCSKCNAEMPPDKPVDFLIFKGVKAITTGYRCKQCGHWNSLNRRKGWSDYKAKARGEQA